MKQDFIDYLFETAHKAGFIDCQLYSIHDQDITVHTKNGFIISAAESASFEGRINGRTVSAYTERFEKADADFLIRSCLDNSSFMEQNKASVLYDQNEPIDFKNYDPDAEDLSKIKAKSQEFQTLIQLYGDQFRDSAINLNAQVKEIAIINDKGLCKHTNTSRIHALAQIVWAQDGRSDLTNFYVDSSKLSQIQFEQPLRQAVENLLGYTSGNQPKTGTYPVIFSGEAYAYLLMVTALFFCKDYVDEGKTRFDHALGKKLFSDCITILDDPHLENGFFSVPFDAQGVPTHKRELVKNGILTSLCCDLSTQQPAQGLFAGCSTRSRINLPPAISVTNLYIQKGNFSRKQLLEKLSDGLLITEVKDYFHRHGSDPVTGNFSMPARGFFVKNGKIAGGAVDFSIEGNLYDILSRVDAIGDTYGYAMPSCLYPGMPMRIGGQFSPDLYIRELSVLGGKI